MPANQVTAAALLSGRMMLLDSLVRSAPRVVLILEMVGLLRFLVRAP